MSETNRPDVYMTIRCRAWRGLSVRTERVSVESDGTVRIYDPVAGHYTLHHDLSAFALRRIRRAARLAGGAS